MSSIPVRSETEKENFVSGVLQAREAIDWSAVLRVVFRIMDGWKVSQADQQTLLASSRSWLAKARAGAKVTLTRDQEDRLSHLLGIYEALEILFPSTEAQEGWMQTPNRDFGECPPLQRALGGSLVDLAYVRSYLDGVRGP